MTERTAKSLDEMSMAELWSVAKLLGRVWQQGSSPEPACDQIQGHLADLQDGC